MCYSYEINFYNSKLLRKEEEFTMGTKCATLLLSTLLATTLYGQNEVSSGKPFFGLEVGYATVQGDVGEGILNTISNYEGSDIEFGVRMGAQENEWRATFGFNYFDGSEDGYVQNYEKFTGNLDYMFLKSNKSTIQPFIGANIGYINYESTNNIDMSGFLYGVQTGVVLSITEHIDIDVQYRYSLGVDASDTFDSIGSAVVGINYLY